MEGLSPSPKLFDELMSWSGFTLTGEEADEELDEPKRALRLINESQELCMSIKDCIVQNPLEEKTCRSFCQLPPF